MAKIVEYVALKCECGETHEMTHHGDVWNFKLLYRFNGTGKISDAPVDLWGMGVYKCKCGNLVLSGFMDIDEDE